MIQFPFQLIYEGDMYINREGNYTWCHGERKMYLQHCYGSEKVEDYINDHYQNKHNAFLFAVEELDTEQLRHMLSKGIDFSDKDLSFAALLGWCRNKTNDKNGLSNYAERLNLLIKNGIDINAQAPSSFGLHEPNIIVKGDTVLSYAVRNKKYYTVETFHHIDELVKNGANSAIKNIHGYSSIEIAGNDKELQRALSNKREIISEHLATSPVTESTISKN